MKKIITSAMAGAMVLSIGTSFASSDVLPTISFSPEFSRVESVREERDLNVGTTLDRIKNKGRILISQRISALTSNKTVIESSKQLTDAQKSSIVTRINDNVTRLTTLGTTLASSTDATSSKALVGSIFTDFRIYAIVIPQVRLEKRVYDLQNHAGKLSEVFVKTQAKIDEKKTAGYDVTTWQKALDDAKVLVANDLHKLDTLKTTTLALTPASYGTTSKATIEAVNKGLKEVKQDFDSVRKLNNKDKFLPKAKIEDKKKFYFNDDSKKASSTMKKYDDNPHGDDR